MESVRGQLGAHRQGTSPYAGPRQLEPGLSMALLPRASQRSRIMACDSSPDPSLNSHSASGIWSTPCGVQVRSDVGQEARFFPGASKSFFRHRLTPWKEEVGLMHCLSQSTCGESCRECAWGSWEGVMPGTKGR